MSAILSDPHPCRHIVYPYTDEEKAVNAVHLFASSGLSKKESVVLIMADSHRQPITGRLANGGYDLAGLQASGQLGCFSAENMLRELMPGGTLDEALFKDRVRRIVGPARASSPSRKVRIFGEMVSLLLARNEVVVAERLERLWNEVIAAHSVSLFCTYTLLDSGYPSLPPSLERLHSHNLTLGLTEPAAAVVAGASAND